MNGARWRSMSFVKRLPKDNYGLQGVYEHSDDGDGATRTTDNGLLCEQYVQKVVQFYHC